MFASVKNRSIFPDVTSNNTHNFDKKGSALTMQCNNQKELLRVLELLNTTHDVDLQLKIFACLSAYIMYKRGADMNIIIKCNALYDKIQYVLEKGMPRKATDALNFLSTLLFIDGAGEETTTKKTLALYARNMTRISGCLATMCEMFTSSMMYLDTWKALCQCLAVACSECELNQSYCTHLIPICVKKCSQENIDIIMVLQALLMNHNRNIKLFIDCNGISILTRDLLHYDKCLHLLTTLVQCSEASAVLVSQTCIVNNLKDFLRLYGPNSQIGQKAVIILNHIDSRVRESSQQNRHPVPNTNHNNTVLNVTQINKTSDMEPVKDLDETSVLMQNVMKELFLWNNDVNNTKKMNPENNANKRTSELRNKVYENAKVKQQTRKNRELSNVNDLSFSFLNNKHTDTKMVRADTTLNLININVTKQNVRKLTKSNSSTTLDSKDFKPMFVSTPKHLKKNISKIQTHSKADKENYNYKGSSRDFQNQRENKLFNIKQKRNKYKIEKRTNKKEYGRDLRNQSIGSRFFSAINDSCTTLVKTVKNIFTTKKSEDHTETGSGCSKFSEKHSCSYSFTKYMKKRDAELNNKLTNKNNSKFSNETNSCQTCDDTQTLKQKLVKDENLRQTIKKLKLGINLYGCDFKKISRTMWPRESYMTPAVLYNLYRKLILK